MVARIVSGKSIRGILSYNENKIKNAEATLLLAAGFPRDPARLSLKNKLERFEKLTRQNERTRTNALHITLNFSSEDVLDDALLQRIALDYMERIGFGQQPFLLYRHYDAAHPHVHIATVNIAEGGERIETHNIGKYLSEKARKELEIVYDLVKAEDQKQETAYQLRPAILEKATYGKRETKAAISGIVREVVSNFKYCSLAELNAALRQFNVLADPGKEGSRMHKKGGLVYSLLDEKGQKVGVPIKASSIYKQPTLKNLALKFTVNKVARKPYGLRLKHLLDKAFASADSPEELTTRLQKQGIRILLRENALGYIYGVTFIDNGTRAVFNGSSLCKTYSGRAFSERLKSMGVGPVAPSAIAEMEPIAQGVSIEDNEPSERKHPAHELPVIETLMDALMSDEYQEEAPNPFKRKKKKRLQKE